jgi:hypothetical protein
MKIETRSGRAGINSAARSSMKENIMYHVSQQQVDGLADAYAYERQLEDKAKADYESVAAQDHSLIKYFLAEVTALLKPGYTLELRDWNKGICYFVFTADSFSSDTVVSQYDLLTKSVTPELIAGYINDGPTVGGWHPAANFDWQ